MSLKTETFATGTFVGRVWLKAVDGPAIVHLRNGVLFDVTSREAPTMRDLLEMDNPVAWVQSQTGKALFTLDDAVANGLLLAPNDLQAVKACGVTFARSMIERVIEEKAAGNPDLAERVRERVTALIGDSLRNLKAGSEQAAKVKAALIEEGVWSQYLEVAIGPDAEVFTKSPVLSSVGWGDEVGVRSDSTWNNPEPEVVMVVTPEGRAVGATLGNDVNLRCFEGRSALLLGKAKDNNASCALGPFIRMFDDSFTIDDVRSAVLDLKIDGPEGYELVGRSTMSEISRDPLDLIGQAMSEHHYPDGFVLMLGTLFAPTQDRDTPGRGFTHKVGDVVKVSSPKLGCLENRVTTSKDARHWNFGIADLMQNLADRGLLKARNSEQTHKKTA